MNRYDTLNEPVTFVVSWIPERARYERVPSVPALWGRHVQPDPDAQLEPDSTLFRGARAENVAAIRAAAAQRADATDRRVYDYLRRRGPCTVGAIASGLGTHARSLRDVLARRPDLFVTVGEKRAKNGSMATLWGAREDYD